MTHRDHLDDAIERVGARLTRVEQDDELLARIVARLPRRSSSLGWLLGAWAPRLAIVALGAIAITGVLAPLEDPSTAVLRTENANLPTVQLRASIEPVVPNRTKPLERLEPPERPEPLVQVTVADHEFALPAIAAVAPLALDNLMPASMSAAAPLTLAPLAIVELPLTADFSPR
jgi:hypothetical protein